MALSHSRSLSCPAPLSLPQASLSRPPLPRPHASLSLSCLAPLSRPLSLSRPAPLPRPHVPHITPPQSLPPFPCSQVPPLACGSPFLRPRVPLLLSHSPFPHVCVPLSPFPRPALTIGTCLDGPLPAHPCLRGLQIQIYFTVIVHSCILITS
jgi:hypothetical protein